MRNGCVRIAALILISVAPAGAALPEDGIRACESLWRKLVYIGEAGVPFRHRLFQERIDRAREMLSKTKAAYDKSPENIQLHLAVLDAESDLQDWTAKSTEMTLVPMKIERMFRGNPAGESFVVLKDNMNVEPGRSYVFYGDTGWAPVGLEAYEGWMQEVSTAANAVRVLESSVTSGGGALFGALELEHANDGKRTTPLASTRIRLTAPGFTENVTTDIDGIFIASNVPPGPVTITPTLPQQLAVTNHTLLTAQVIGGRCTSVNLRAALNGRIRGRITSGDGKPRAGLTIEVLPVGYSNLGPPGDQRYRARTNERGEYEFRALPPGSYVVGHQIHRHDVVPPGGYPPSTYFPGVPNGRAATPVVVGNATQHDGVDFVVDVQPAPTGR
jgi:hypothetical protein